MSLKKEEKAKKLVLVLTISMSVTTAKKEAAQNTQTGKTGENVENGKNRKKGENLGINLVQVSYI